MRLRTDIALLRIESFWWFNVVEYVMLSLLLGMCIKCHDVFLFPFLQTGIEHQSSSIFHIHNIQYIEREREKSDDVLILRRNNFWMAQVCVQNDVILILLVTS
jgi:hypothetical protein